MDGVNTTSIIEKVTTSIIEKNDLYASYFFILTRNN